MMNPTRRELLKSAGVCLVATGIARPLAAMAAAASTQTATLTEGEWRCLEAACERILPRDEQPGATDAGCVNFIDKALAHEDAAALPLYRGALAALDAYCRGKHGNGFADLPTTTQDQILSAIDTGALAPWPAALGRPQDFFATLRFHTLAGFLADPKYGGNRAFAGWRAVGFPGPLHLMGGASAAQMQGKAPLMPIWEQR